MEGVLYPLSSVTMKTTFKVFGSIVALGLVILVVFHVVLLYGLTKAMRDVVLPQLKEETGIDARVGRLSINVAAGMLYLNDVEAGGETDFIFQQASVTPEKGKLMLFPPFWTHEHRGVTLEKGVKYIATTWVVFA